MKIPCLLILLHLNLTFGYLYPICGTKSKNCGRTLYENIWLYLTQGQIEEPPEPDYIEIVLQPLLLLYQSSLDYITLHWGEPEPEFKSEFVEIEGMKIPLDYQTKSKYCFIVITLLCLYLAIFFNAMKKLLVIYLRYLQSRNEKSLKDIKNTSKSPLLY